jgi:hypothetical protein
MRTLAASPATRPLAGLRETIQACQAPAWGLFFPALLPEALFIPRGDSGGTYPDRGFQP